MPHQTLYAELVELCAIAAMEDEFPEPGVFSAKEVKGRRYWYFEPSGTPGDRAAEPLEILRAADPTYRPVPSLDKHTTSYINGDGLRVEFLAPKKRERGTVPLPALQAHAQDLGYVDYLIAEPVQAAVLSGAGILVNVPNPARYAWHKLVIAGERRNKEKAGKDLEQARILIEALSERSADSLKGAAQDFLEGQTSKRKEIFRTALARLSLRTRDTALRVMGWSRNEVPGAHITFSRSPFAWDFDRDVAVFSASEAGVPIRCAISREALEDHFPNVERPGTRELDLGRLRREKIEQLATVKYLDRPIPSGKEAEEFDLILRSTDDLPWPGRRRGRSG